MMRWIIRNWLTISVGLILTALAVRYAYNDRGYIAFGSEWLVMPFLFLLRGLYLDMRKEIKRWL